MFSPTIAIESSTAWSGPGTAGGAVVVGTAGSGSGAAGSGSTASAGSVVVSLDEAVVVVSSAGSSMVLVVSGTVEKTDSIGSSPPQLASKTEAKRMRPAVRIAGPYFTMQLCLVPGWRRYADTAAEPQVSVAPPR